MIFNSNYIDLSIAELGVIVNNLQSYGSDIASSEDVQRIVQAIIDYAYNNLSPLGDDMFEMWVQEFDISE